MSEAPLGDGSFEADPPPSREAISGAGIASRIRAGVYQRRAGSPERCGDVSFEVTVRTGDARTARDVDEIVAAPDESAFRRGERVSVPDITRPETRGRGRLLAYLRPTTST